MDDLIRASERMSRFSFRPQPMVSASHKAADKWFPSTHYPLFGKHNMVPSEQSKKPPRDEVSVYKSAPRMADDVEKPYIPYLVVPSPVSPFRPSWANRVLRPRKK